MATTTRKSPPREHKLPIQQLVVLSLARFAEPIAVTSVFPYLPEMVEWMDVAPDEVAKWAGFAASVFSLSQAVFAVPWGRASDRYGRKPAILTCLTGTMVMTVLWGFSRSLTMAITIRVLQGFFSGNVGIIRTTVAEMVPWKELQPRAFSIMPLVWNIGSIFGPTLGGALANPKRIKPGTDLGPDAGLLDKFPYVLPNLVAAVIFAVGITTGLLFLDESLATAKDRRDYGRDAGRGLVGAIRGACKRLRNRRLPADDDEQQSLLKSTRRSASPDEETQNYHEVKKPVEPPPSISECLTKQSVLNLFCYTLLAMHNLAFDGLIPIFMHYRKHDSRDPNRRLPFKFSGGFGLDSREIGVLFTVYGVSGMVVQFFVFPPVARKYGVVRCLRVCSVAMPIIYLVVPFTALLEDSILQQVVGITLMISKGFFSTFAFPCATILLTNSASSLRILGTLNGVAVSVSALGRAAGPALVGTVFTYGAEAGYVLASWWTLALIGILAAIPVFWIVEGEGFGGDDEELEDSDDEGEDERDGGFEEGEGEDEEDQDLTPTANRTGVLETALNAGASVEDVAQQRPDYGTFRRVSTVSSVALSEHSEEVESPRGSRRYDEYDSPASTRTRDRAMSAASASASALRRNSRTTPARRMSRKVSIPIGMAGMSRRYSSNIGQTLGSAGGH